MVCRKICFLSLLAFLLLSMPLSTHATAQHSGIQVISAIVKDGVAYFGINDTIAIEIPFSALPAGFDVSNVTVYFCDAKECHPVVRNVDLNATEWVEYDDVLFKSVPGTNGLLLLLRFLSYRDELLGKELSVLLESNDVSVQSRNKLEIVPYNVAVLDKYVVLSKDVVWYGQEFKISVNISGVRNELSLPDLDYALTIFLVNRLNATERYVVYSSSGDVSTKGFKVIRSSLRNGTVDVELVVEDFKPSTDKLMNRYDVVVVFNKTGVLHLEEYNVTLRASVFSEAVTENRTVVLRPSIEVVSVNKSVFGSKDELNPYDEMSIVIHNVPNQTIQRIVVEVGGERYVFDASKYVMNATYNTTLGILTFTLAIPPAPWNNLSGNMWFAFSGGEVKYDVNGDELALRVVPVVEFKVLSPNATLSKSQAIRTFVPSNTIVYGDYVEVIAWGVSPNITVTLGARSLELVEKKVVEPGYVVAVYRPFVNTSAGVTALRVSNGVFERTFIVRFTTYSFELQKILVNPELVFNETSMEYVIVENVGKPVEVHYELVNVGGEDKIAYGKLNKVLVLEVIGYGDSGKGEVYFKYLQAELYYPANYTFSVERGYSKINLTNVPVPYLPLGFYTIALRICGEMRTPESISIIPVFFNRMTIDVDPDVVARGGDITITIAGCPLYRIDLPINVSIYVNGTLYETYEFTIGVCGVNSGLYSKTINTQFVIPPAVIQSAIDKVIKKNSYPENTVFNVTGIVTVPGVVGDIRVYEKDESKVYSLVVIVRRNILDDVEGTYTEIPSTRVVVDAPRTVVSGERFPIYIYIHTTNVSRVVPEKLIEETFRGGYIEIATYNATTFQLISKERLSMSTPKAVARLIYTDLDGDGKKELVIVIEAKAPAVEKEEFLIYRISVALSNKLGSVSLSSHIEDYGYKLKYSYNKTYVWIDPVVIRSITTGIVSVVGEPKRYYNIVVDLSEVLTKLADISKKLDANRNATISELKALIQRLKEDLGGEIKGIVALVDERNAEVIAVLRNTTIKVRVDPGIVTDIYKLMQELGTNIKEYISDNYQLIEGYLGDIRVRIARLPSAESISNLRQALEEKLANLKTSIEEVEKTVSQQVVEQSNRVAELGASIDLLRSQIDTLRTLLFAVIGLLGVVAVLVVIVGRPARRRA